MCSNQQCTSAAMSWGAAAAGPAALFFAADDARDVGFFSFFTPAFFLVLPPLPPASTAGALVASTLTLPPLRDFLVMVTEGSDNKVVKESEIEDFKSGEASHGKLINE